MLDTFQPSQVNPLNDVEKISVRLVRAVLAGGGVCLFGLVFLAPFVLGHIPEDYEVWILQAIREAQASLHLVPFLNSHPISEVNPLNVLVLSLIPSGDIIFFRLISVILALFVSAVVFVFCSRLWNLKTALFATLTSITSMGFILTYTSLSGVVIPASLGISSYLIFCLAYLNDKKGSWYVFAYLLASLAVISGGWIMLAFFAFSVIFLILLDLSPAKFTAIRAVSGIVMLVVFLLVFYLTFRIAGGTSFVSHSLSPGSDLGFFASIALFGKYNLPWLPLIVPAWIYTARPEDQDAWRKLLPIKIAFVMSLACLWLSRHCLGGYAVLGVPFGAILVGYWLGTGMKSFPRFKSLPYSAVLLAGAIALATMIVVLGVPMFRAGSVGWIEVYILLGAAGALIAFFLLIKRGLLYWALAISILVMLGSSWAYSFVYSPHRLEARIEAIQKMAIHTPLVVFEDDLVMRGYLGYIGKQPVLVSRDIVPLGVQAYLAVTTDDPDDLIETLNSRMEATLEDSFEDRKVYTLLKLSPLALD